MIFRGGHLEIPSGVSFSFNVRPDKPKLVVVLYSISVFPGRSGNNKKQEFDFPVWWSPPGFIVAHCNP
jgi:hypothetical protein